MQKSILKNDPKVNRKLNVPSLQTWRATFGDEALCRLYVGFM